MNRTLAVLSLAVLLSSGSFEALAADVTEQGSTAPPAAAQRPESNQEKADKKGEEASGSNSGADSKTMEKEAATSGTSTDTDRKTGASDSDG